MSSSTSAEMLRLGSKPASKRASSSAKYDSMQKRAAALGGVLDVDGDQPRSQQALDDPHRLDEPRALVLAQRDEQR